MRRVLFSASILDSSGVPTHMYSLARVLKQHCWEVAIASSGQVGSHSHGPDWFEAGGIPHFTVRFPNYYSAGWDNMERAIQAAADLNRVVRDWQPDLLHVHYRVTSPYARLIQAIYGIPFVSTLHLDGIPAGPI